ncbi:MULTISPECIES: adaptor protein MecA [Oceanobacillus]|uniref:Adapter protein MecA n=1 Tax=Oceanobacillus kimchii TaxID=746691 RepID=A0ABQ5TFL3_9BACI|nr:MULTISPECIES: adaptor protein MecA [Oceanobacillus]MBT2599027.1 adaptor protein MecA [Oceanobacillus sp. ISL-74]MBT2651945.1 adaptor protein MecA [Oceanobacillus sp. ISL-73]MCT1578718.1 adaptor protein MecA [Oceanobacillus kimchii]MCT2136233.1 adaptor protein MecA [Oceanobacillus kimchii]OEH54352.1 adaptor protein MecA [Oceanobacillus sp. E9]
MEIERINENTIKFYISYLDIEELGFEREEIWYNRERSEQLFWQMMDEVNYREDFNPEGPLWIQVQAMEKGLEIIVTKAKVSKNGEHLELDTEDGSVDIPVDEKIESILGEKFGKNPSESEESDSEDDDLTEDNLWIIVEFDDFEDLIQLSHQFVDISNFGEETLYFYNGKYYLYMEFSYDVLDDNRQEDVISQVLEYASDSSVSIHVLEEYGKKVMENDTFSSIREHFPLHLK